MNDASSPKTDQPLFFSVSGLKLVVMSTVTFGIYELYWLYRHWRAVREHFGRSDIMPFWRAFFGFFFCYQLFKTVKDTADSHGVPSRFSPGLLAVAWIALTLCWKLPDPFWLIDVFAVLPLLTVQRAINSLHSQLPTTDYDHNRKFTAANIVGIVVGGLLFVLAIIGSFIPE
jgi:hypothetical protein